MVDRLEVARVYEAPPAPSPIRVVLGEDHAMMRRSLRLLLDGEKDIEVIAEASDLAGAIAQVNGCSPDVLVLDLQMPDGSSLDAIWILREHAPDTQIVALTMDQNPGFATRAAEAGARACVLKDRADAELAEAIRRAMGEHANANAHLSAPIG